MSSLNKEQYRASLPCGGVDLLIAGAGTGKTKTLVEKVRNVIADEFVKPENILILTFSRKAAQEIKDRIKVLVGNSAGKITSGTFHSFCLSFLREHSMRFVDHFGLIRFPDILDEEERLNHKNLMLRNSL